MSRHVVVCGIDQGYNLCGTCVGDGASRPVAGAFRFSGVGDDVGALGFAYRAAMQTLFERHEVTHVIFEAPLLIPRNDKLLTLRKRLGIDMILEVLCRDMGIVCEEESVAALKKTLAGMFDAEKADMVAAAEKIGIVLPKAKADGREDAADAVAPWLVGIRLHARQHLERWDRALYGSRGFLL